MFLRHNLFDRGILSLKSSDKFNWHMVGKNHCSAIIPGSAPHYKIYTKNIWFFLLALAAFELFYNNRSGKTREGLGITRWRNSHRRCLIKNGVLGNFAKFTGKHLSQSLFLIKMQVWKASSSKKKTLLGIVSKKELVPLVSNTEKAPAEYKQFFSKFR